MDKENELYQQAYNEIQGLFQERAKYETMNPDIFTGVNSALKKTPSLGGKFETSVKPTTNIKQLSVTQAKAEAGVTKPTTSKVTPQIFDLVFPENKSDLETWSPLPSEYENINWRQLAKNDPMKLIAIAQYVLPLENERLRRLHMPTMEDLQTQTLAEATPEERHRKFMGLDPQTTIDLAIQEYLMKSDIDKGKMEVAHKNDIERITYQFGLNKLAKDSETMPEEDLYRKYTEEIMNSKATYADKAAAIAQMKQLLSGKESPEQEREANVEASVAAEKRKVDYSIEKSRGILEETQRRERRTDMANMEEYLVNDKHFSKLSKLVDLIEESRFKEKDIDEAQASTRISAVKNSLLVSMLNSAKAKQYIKELVKDGMSEQEAKSYVEELILNKMSYVSAGE